jgi:signal peptide peptidase-like 2B
MVCDKNETDLNINIAAVMLPKDAGVSLEELLKDGHSGYIHIPLSLTLLFI